MPVCVDPTGYQEPVSRVAAGRRVQFAEWQLGGGNTTAGLASARTGFLDWVPKKMQRVGCVELLNTIQRRIQPRLHVFGHIHEGYGVMADGTTTYVNASVCTMNYQPLNPPIVIDLPTPRNT
ncbi:MPPED1: Metallophosphoesterase domain-containing protein 1 [Crotalus adamanteus]|uniref:MPPED1: Metallophosphoesterase domain-containing protein 1 n=1 Tax=Crotalus adamanteus TaxID=8729 RepID=A0AAW1BC29_CROAD